MISPRRGRLSSLPVSWASTFNGAFAPHSLPSVIMRTERIWPSCEGRLDVKTVIVMKESVKEKTDRFISEYLVPGEIGKGYGLYRMLADSGGTDKGRIAVAIRRMPYVDYLHTRYWRLVSLQVKHDAGCRCELCGSGGGLVVHHRGYRDLGYDMYHIDGLQCLCQRCHERVHGLRDEPRAHPSRPRERQDGRLTA